MTSEYQTEHFFFLINASPWQLHTCSGAQVYNPLPVNLFPNQLKLCNINVHVQAKDSQLQKQHHNGYLLGKPTIVFEQEYRLKFCICLNSIIYMIKKHISKLSHALDLLSVISVYGESVITAKTSRDPIKPDEISFSLNKKARIRR